jgi:cyclohexadienyl dehydratase
MASLCNTGDHHPFPYRNPQGRWSGTDIEMAQDLATRLDVELNVVPTTWGTMMKDLGSRCDIAMGAISVTPDRAQHALYSIPYVRDGAENDGTYAAISKRWMGQMISAG